MAIVMERVGIRGRPSKAQRRLRWHERQPKSHEAPRLLCQRNYAKSAAKAQTPPFGEMGMADHTDVQYANAMGNDYPAHEQTYRNFITLVKASLAVIVVILILMAVFLA